MKRKVHWPAYAASAVALMASAPGAFAQEADTTAAAAEDNGEIVVTAQRRNQSIQDVPISMTAVTGEALLDQQISGLQDLSATLPNVHISQDTISNNIYMRGVGSGVSPGFEQAIAIFVDDSYRGRSRYTASTFVDVERIEVLRGPQSTYFGNNAIGGAFSVTTRGPSLADWGGYAQGSYEFEAEEQTLEAAVGGPIVQDKLGVRLAVRLSDMDGWLDNEGTGGTDPDVEDSFFRLSGLWQINNDWAASFKAESGSQDNEGAFGAQIVGCPPDGIAASGSCLVALANNANTTLDFTRASNGGEIGSVDAEEYIFKLERDNDNGLGVVLQGTYSSGDFITSGDTDATTADRTTYSNIEATEQKTVELRFISPDEGRLQYLFGAYYLNSEFDFQSNFNLLSLTSAVVPFIAGGAFAAAAPFAPFTVDTNIISQEEAFSVFGSATWEFSDTLSATLSGRYTDSRKSAVQDSQPTTTLDRYGFNTALITDPAALAAATALTSTTPHVSRLSIEDEAFLPAVTLQYEPSATQTFYASYSEGFKAGGFDPMERSGDLNRLSYDPEHVQAFELGMKSSWFDRSVITNFALYRSDYEDLQQAVVRFDGVGAFVTTTNVGGLVSQGLEGSILWRANDNWEFSTDFAWMDAHYLDYDNATCTIRQTIATPTGTTCTQDLSGEAPPFSPDFAGAVRASYNHPIGANLVFTADGTMSFSGEYNVAADKDPYSSQDSWEKFDLRLGIGDADDTWQFAVLGQNLTNEVILATMNDLVGTNGSYFATVERGRQISVQLRYNW